MSLKASNIEQDLVKKDPSVASDDNSADDASTSPPSTESGNETSDSDNNSSSSTSTSSTSGSSSSSSGTSSSSSSSDSTDSSSSSSSSSDDGEKPDTIPTLTAEVIPLQYFIDADFRLQNQQNILPFAERAIVKEWSTQLGCWVSRQSIVLIYHQAFARGCMRSSFHLIDFQCPTKNFVAKQYRKSSVPVSQYFDDVAMHSIAEHWATQFNNCNPPKKVRFVPAAVLELCFRAPPLVFAIEPHLVGEFKKHNNNNGYVAEDNRCTPQAFSHFTFHKSHGQLMIVDIQGVGDDYTDPQIMSLDGEGYGRGNLGRKGMEKFLKTHSCNGVCEQLGLPRIGPNTKVSPNKKGKKAAASKRPPLGGAGAAVGESQGGGVQQTPRRSIKNSAKVGATPRLSEDDVALPQHLPPKEKSMTANCNEQSPPAGGHKRRAGHNILRESLKTVSSGEHTDALISIAPPPPQPELSMTADYFMHSTMSTSGAGSGGADGAGDWGTLSYVEQHGAGGGAAMQNPSQEYVALVERQAQRKAEKDMVLLDA